MKKIKTKLALTGIVLSNTLIANVAYAADPQAKLVEAGNTIKTVITALIVIVGGIAAAKIVVQYLPLLDDPMEKNKMTKALTTVLLVTAVGGALTWIVPWAYGLLN